MLCLTVGILSAAGSQAYVFAAEIDPNKNRTRYLSERDAKNFLEGLFAADRRSWNDTKIFKGRLDNDIAAAVLEWRYLSAQNTYPTFSQIVTFLENHPDWPQRKELLRRAEETLPHHHDPKKVVALFSGREPLTGDGKIKLGSAYVKLGQKEYGHFWIKQAWTQHRLTPDLEKHVLANHLSILSKKDHQKRLEFLLWQRASSAARRQFRFVDREDQIVAQARLDLAASRNKAASLKPVPKSRLDDPGLIYEQVRRYREADMEKEARKLLLKAPQDEHKLVRPDLWWRERHILARHAIEQKLFGEAYQLAAMHASEAGIDFAESQWLAGWLSLRYLNDPDQAVVHFQNLHEGVRFPISKARAAYWLGRSFEQLGKNAQASQWYNQAASLQTTYYGQLAAERISYQSTPTINLPQPWTISRKDVSNVLNLEVVKASILLHDFGQPKTLKSFVTHLAEHFDEPTTLAGIANLMGQMGYPHYSLRVAKKASLKHVFLIDQSYPVTGIPQPSGKTRTAEPALVLGLSRQESEFNPMAESPAGALGAMQLMPATAKEVARQYGLRYDVYKLKTDPSYNMTLGSAYLSGLVRRFDGSYILAAAAYNAGPSRVRQWLNIYGDPRKPQIDPIDWIEMIPYNETRNYVQRILENTQVYRYQLAKRETPLLLSADLGLKTHRSPQLAKIIQADELAPLTSVLKAPTATKNKKSDNLDPNDHTNPPSHLKTTAEVPTDIVSKSTPPISETHSNDIIASLIQNENNSPSEQIPSDTLSPENSDMATKPSQNSLDQLRELYPHIPIMKPSPAILQAKFARPRPKPSFTSSGDSLEIRPQEKPGEPS